MKQPKFQMLLLLKSTYLVFAFSLLLACSKSNDDTDPDNGNTPVLSSAKAIVNFNLISNPTFCEREVSNAIDDVAGIIEIEVTNSTSIQSLDPSIELSEEATISPIGPQDFSTAVTYTVTAEDGSVASYEVITTKGPTEREILEKIYEMNPGNTTGWDLNDPDIGNWNGVYTNSNGAVERLVLIQNGIVNFPGELPQLCSLEELAMSGNKLNEIPEVFFELKNIRRLSLGNLGLTNIPDGIGQLTNLWELILVVNQIESISGEIGKLENLEYFQIGENQLKTLPPEIGQLIKLKRLSINTNQLQEIPSEIGQLENLEDLTASWNNLTSIPATIGGLSKLTRLTLNDNQIITLPLEIGSMSSLEQLSLERNMLEELPIEIGDLSTLITLELAANNLSSIPTEIGNLGELRYLLVNGNNLSFLPVEISQLSNLSYLNIYANQLTSISQEICDMVGNYGTQLIKENEVTCE